jgi:hypothetical protein
MSEEKSGSGLCRGRTSFDMLIRERLVCYLLRQYKMILLNAVGRSLLISIVSCEPSEAKEEGVCNVTKQAATVLHPIMVALGNGHFGRKWCAFMQ